MARGRNTCLCVEGEGDTEGESECEGDDGRLKGEKAQTKVPRDVEENVDGLIKA